MKGSDEAFSAESDDESDEELEAESDNALSDVSIPSDSESSGSKRIRRAYSVCLIHQKSGRFSHYRESRSLRAVPTICEHAASARE